MAERNPRAVIFWSSGKDSALVLHRNFKQPEYEIVSLVTTVTEGAGRVTMHGVREELLDRQADLIGLPLQKVPLPFPCPNALYEQKMAETLSGWKAQGVTHALFGDLFLEDIRRYREDRLRKLGITPVFPLWRQKTAGLAEEMLEQGFEAILTCVDTKKIAPTFAGRRFDRQLLKELPQTVDPCGENGEFHTFLFNAPFFREPIGIEIGECVLRQGFTFADILKKT
jgi:uncharacterized protein (TIGR00290 family)